MDINTLIRTNFKQLQYIYESKKHHLFIELMIWLLLAARYLLLASFYRNKREQAAFSEEIFIVK